MATKVTSASPIISADAVEAVRFGFRFELSRASTPAVPPNWVAGQPSTEASGRTTFAALRRDAEEEQQDAGAQRESRVFVPSP